MLLPPKSAKTFHESLQILSNESLLQTFEGAKVFADFGGNNPRLSFEGPNLVFQGEINCLDFRFWSINYI